MATVKITAYDAIVNCDWLGEGAQIQLGVVEEGHPHDAHWDSYADEKIYFYLTYYEFEALKVGDVLNDGEDFTIVEINKQEPTVYEVQYSPEECEQ